MSMAMMSKSEEAEEDTWSTMTPDKRSYYGWRSKSPVWWIRAAAVCLGLLLLVVIFGLVAHNASAIGQRDSLLDHLMKREELIHNLTTDNKALGDELRKMKINSSTLTKEIEVLQRQYNTVAASRDSLLQEVQRLKTTYANASAIGQRDSLQDHLMKHEKMIYNLTTDNSILRDELNQMKINFSRLTEKIEELQRHYNIVLASRDNLVQEVQQLNSSTTCDVPSSCRTVLWTDHTNFDAIITEVCQSGWMMLDNKCYYASEKGQTKTWEDSRKDCLQRGADLVMPTTRQELNSVAKIHDKTWIGLSDKTHEGTWRWVDGTQLQTGFWKTGEPNNAGNEDCAEISGSTGEWNDVLCNGKLAWICEE